MTIARMQVQDKPPTLREAAPDDEWPDELQQVLDRALTKTPGERYQSAKEMLEAIDGVIHSMRGPLDTPASEEATAVVDRSASAVTRKRDWKRIARFGLPALLVVAIASVALAVSLGREPADKPGTAAGTNVAKSELAQRAERHLDSGDARGALEMLERGLVSPAGDRDAYGHFLLGRARTAVGAHAEAVTAYALATSLAPELLASKILRTDLAIILSGKDKAAALKALELVAERPMPGGDDLVIEQASRGKLRDVRQRARALAKQKGVAARVDELESYSLDLEQGATCKGRREAVAKLRTLGRKEAIPALRRAAELRGSSGARRPNACLEKDAAAAIRHLESR